MGPAPHIVADVQLTDFVGLTADNITNLVAYFAGAQPVASSSPAQTWAPLLLAMML